MATLQAGDAKKRVRNAMSATGFSHPHYLIAWSRIVDLLTEDPALPSETMAIASNGKIMIHPNFVATLPAGQLPGCIIHEILHLALGHFERAQSMGLLGTDGMPTPGMDLRLLFLWNVAGDMAINSALRDDGIALPEFAVYPPAEYPSNLGRSTEDYYSWLLQKMKEQDQEQKQDQQGKPQGGQGSKLGKNQRGSGSSLDDILGKDPSKPAKVGAGCGVERGEGKQAPNDPNAQDQDQGGQGTEGNGSPMPGQGPAIGDQLGADLRAGAKLVGKGSSAVSRLLEPKVARIPWRKVLKSGFDTAMARRGLDVASLARPSRRSLAPGAVVMPGRITADPRIAIVIDVSGSMDRKWVEQIVSECEALCKVYPGAKALLITHTDQVTWEGWVKAGQSAKLGDAVNFTGGTDADPAYARVGEIQAETRPFDALIHFTDCELTRWPENPARKLVVGAFGSGATNPYCKPPPNAEVIPCAENI